MGDFFYLGALGDCINCIYCIASPSRVCDSKQSQSKIV